MSEMSSGKTASCFNELLFLNYDIHSAVHCTFLITIDVQSLKDFYPIIQAEIFLIL